MHTSLFKTSIYTRSLLANPPAVALPQIPTLAELRERTEAMPLPIPILSQTKDQGTQTSSSSFSSSSSSWSSPKSLLPAYSTGSSPPEYQPPTLLKSSFTRLNSASTEGQKGITMKGSRGYVRDVKGRFGRQPEIEQVESEDEKKGWISWFVIPEVSPSPKLTNRLTCRG